MGKDKTTVGSSTTVTATPEEKELQRLQLDRMKQNQPYQSQLDQNLYGVINTILQGGTLPNNLQGITGITEQQTQGMVNRAVSDIAPGFQAAGILDSGVAAQISARTAADVRNQNAQFNVTALSQLFNQALGGGSSLNTSVNQQNSILGGQLAGLRSINSTQTTLGMNPFMKSFQQSLGQSLGSGSFGSGGSSSGGGGSSDAFSKAITASIAGCWVASEIFGGWYAPKTILSRMYINFSAPQWLKSFYLKHGERFAKFISNKPVLKIILRPLFELFALKGKYATTR